MMNRAVLACCGVATVVFSATVASAADLDLNWDGMYFGGSSLTAKSSITSGTFYAGAMNWSEVGNAANTYTTFCTEVNQVVKDPSSFDYVDLSDAPDTLGGMGDYRAGLVQGLYNGFYSQALASRTESAAFQIAIWEIVYESGVTSGGSYTLDTAAGGFKITGGSSTVEKDSFGMSAVGLANQWLASLTSSLNVTTLTGLTSSDAQDQIIITPIPLPAPIMLGGLGLLCLPVARRMVRRS